MLLRGALCLLVAAPLVACAKPASSGPATVSSASGTVGYVRMNDLVKVHPLYSQLNGYDESLEALNVGAVVPQVARPDAAIAREEAALQAELNAAAERTRRLLAQKSRAYQLREQAAIAVALRSAGTSGPSAAAIAAQIDRTAQSQAAGVSAQARRDFESYRKTLVDQDNGELAAAQKALADRAQRQYRAKADELGAKESALSLDEANRDAPTRLSLRTRLSSLALDDTQRDDVRNSLAALDRREGDALAALKNRDAQTLAALGAQLRAALTRDIRAKADEIHTRSIAKMHTREGDIRREFSGGTVASATGLNARAGPPAKVAPQLRSTIVRLHGDYQKQFNADAKSTIDDFNRTREDLRRRYAQLRGIDAAAQSGASAQATLLTKKRADLYAEMVAQIGREVRLIAQQRGISVVVTDPVANAGGIDLTSDAMKDIESLHE